MRQSGHTGTQNALASSWLSWGEKLAEPRYGAIAIIRSRSAAGNAATGSSTGYHVGFLVEQTDKARHPGRQPERQRQGVQLLAREVHPGGLPVARVNPGEGR